MRLALRFLAAALALAVPTAQAGGVPGGYSDTKLTDELSSLLYKALANETVYASGVTSRVCACKISSVQQQVVAGMNYRFTTNACDVQKTLLLHSNKTPKPAEVTKQLGKCKKSFQRNCVEVTATVTVYRSFDDSLKVSSIETTEAPLKQASVHAHPN